LVWKVVPLYQVYFPEISLMAALKHEKWTYDENKNLLVPPEIAHGTSSFDVTADRLETSEVKHEAEFADFARLTAIAMDLKGGR
jgi:hypothetical protein